MARWLLIRRSELLQRDTIMEHKTPSGTARWLPLRTSPTSSGREPSTRWQRAWRCTPPRSRARCACLPSCGSSIPFIAKHGGYQIMIRASYVIRKSSKHILLDGGVLANETDSLYAQGPAHQHIGDEDHDESDRAWFQEKFHAKANAPQDAQIYFM
mmetsp:Transcript_90289/g.229595  ORF Transcript_90289/g.229595 Transcript_90289/m.229595 type:complete len:156 (-) Transcript_90289:142-609(-)